MLELGPGNAIVQYGGLSEPFPVYFPYAGDPEKYPDESKIQTNKKRFLEQYGVNRYEPPKGYNFSSPDKREAPPEAAIKVNHLSEHERTLLEASFEHEFLKYSDLIQKAGLNTTQAQKAKASLIDEGLIEPKKIKIRPGGGAAALYLTPTEKAYKVLGRKKPQAGNTSFEHRLFAHTVAEYYERKGYTTRLEHKLANGHPVDVFAEKDGQVILVEVTLSFSNLSQNISLCRGEGTDNPLVIVAKDKKALRKCRSIVSSREQIDFKLIQDFV